MYPERVMKALQRAQANIHAGDPAAAIDDLEKAVQKVPKGFDAWLLLGQARSLLEDHAAAESCYRKAAALQPRHPDAWANLGMSLSAREMYEPAIAAYTRSLAVSLQPHPDIVHNLGSCYLQLDRYEEALRVFKDLVLMKDTSDVWVLLGMAYQGLDLYPEALSAYQKAIEKGGEGYTLNLNIGTCHDQLADYDAAAKYAELALEATPGDEVARYNLASARLMAGRVGEAVDLLTDCTLPAARQARLLALNYLDPADPVRLRREHEEAARLLCADISDALPAIGKAENGPLRVGFVSADFRDHPVAYFLQGLLGRLDPSRLQVFIYSAVRREDGVTSRFRDLGHQWRDISRTDDPGLAQAVGADGIHILIDLAGHTNGSRLAAFGRRMAPVQATYLGYATTTGLPTMDYLLADEIIAPAGQCDSHYCERLIRLGKVFASYTPPALDVPVGSSPMAQKGFPTFASFAQLRKISPSTVDLWAAALKAVPQARMLVMAKGLDKPLAQARFLEPFAAQGVDPGRFDLRGTGSMQDYLEAHRDIDLILDSTPWNGHTTTLHGLWMGVPTMTLGGHTQAARFGEMVMKAAGLEDFLAPTPAEFAPRLVRLLADNGHPGWSRQGVRNSLLASPLCDHDGLVRRFEAACQVMWQSYESGR